MSITAPREAAILAAVIIALSLPNAASCAEMTEPTFQPGIPVDGRFSTMLQSTTDIKFVTGSGVLKERHHTIPAGRFKQPSWVTKTPAESSFFYSKSERRLYIGPVGFGKINLYWHWLAFDLDTLEGEFINAWKDPRCFDRLPPEHFDGRRINLNALDVSPAVAADAKNHRGESFFFLRPTPSGKLKWVVGLVPTCSRDLKRLDPLAGLIRGRSLRLVFVDPALVMHVQEAGPGGSQGQLWDVSFSIGIAEDFDTIVRSLTTDFRRELFCSMAPEVCGQQELARKNQATGLLISTFIALNSKEGSLTRRVAACSAAHLAGELVEDQKAAALVEEVTANVLKRRELEAEDIATAVLAADLIEKVEKERADISALIKGASIADCLFHD